MCSKKIHTLPRPASAVVALKAKALAVYETRAHAPHRYSHHAASTAPMRVEVDDDETAHVVAEDAANRRPKKKDAYSVVHL